MQFNVPNFNDWLQTPAPVQPNQFSMLSGVNPVQVPNMPQWTGFNPSLEGQVSTGLSSAMSNPVQPNWFDKAGSFYSANKDLIGGGMTAVTGLLGAYNGYQANKQAKESLQFSRDSFNKQYENQKQLTNLQLENRAQMRYGADPTRQMKPSEFMAKYGIK